MKISLLTRLITIGLFSSLLIVGCKKETSDKLTEQEEEQAAIATNESQTESEFVFNDVYDNVMGVNTEVGIGGTGIFGRRTQGSSDLAGREMDVDSTHCWIVSIVRLNPPNAFPVKIIIDFGAGCVGHDGHFRSGKIITEYTNRLIVPGASATTTFQNFKIDSISVQGIHKITNTTASTPGSNQKQFTVNVRDAKLTKPNGNYTEWRSDRIFTQIEGNGTIIPHDDILRIEGSAQGRVKRGNLLFGWHSEIDANNPLIKKFICRWISKGTVRTRRDTLPSTSPWVAVLDFGPGTCDFHATLTINGVVHQIQLPH
jgi:hypothetical protein